MEYVRAEGIAIDWLLETHAHADHLSAAAWIKERLGGAIAIGEHIRDVQAVFGDIFKAGPEFSRDGEDFDRLWSDGDSFAIGDMPVTVLHVPGHTQADRKSVVLGKSVSVSVDLGGRRIIKKKTKIK